jgi:hypothetical protein
LKKSTPEIMVTRKMWVGAGLSGEDEFAAAIRRQAGVNRRGAAEDEGAVGVSVLLNGG